MPRESMNVTPSRLRAQAASEKTYVPFNPRPDQVGTRSGKAMPSNVPRTSEGFEDPEAFFRSPNTTIESRSFSLALSRTPGGGAGSIAASSPAGTLYNTPGGQSSSGRSRAARAAARSDAGSVGFQTPVASGRGGQRLSDLDDVEDEAAVGAGLLADDEFGGPSHFSPSNAPALSFPRSSRLPPASPSVAYDSLPSPSIASPSRRRRATGGASSASPQQRRNLSHSTSSALANVTRMDEEDDSITYDAGVPGGDVTLGDELGDVTAEADMSVDQNGFDNEGDSFATTTTNRTTNARRVSTKSRNQQDDDEDEEEQAEDEDDSRANLSRSARGKKSLSSRRSTIGNKTVDPNENDEEEEDGFQPDMMDNGYDDNDNGMDEPAEYGVGDRRTPEDDEEEEGSVELERRAVQAEGGDEDADEDDEDDPAPREKTEVKTVRGKVGRPKVQKIPREKRPAGEPVRPAEKKRMRLSRIGEETEDGYSGDFTTRRSARRHIKPLAYWRGEKVTYRSGDHIAELDEIVRVPVEPAAPLAARYKRGVARARARSRSVATRIDEEDEDDANDAETNPVGVVKEFATDKEISRRVALPTSRLDPKEVTGSGFRYQKVFGEDQFIAAGVVYIPVGGSKPGKHSKDNSYVFFVQQGTVKVDIHRTSFILCKGGQFMVPRGNQYSITNMSEKLEAQLFFAQARKLRMSEEEDLALQRINAASQSADGASQSQRSRTSSAVPSKKASKSAARRDDSETGGEITPKRKNKSGKRLAA